MSENEFNKIFSINLRRYLDLHGMSQVELAKRLNVGTTSVYNWCNGIKTPRMNKVDEMCRIFSCKRSDLIVEPAAPESFVPVQLRPDERELLEKYNLLNDLGRNKVYEYVSDLTENEKYIRALEESNEAC